MDVGRAFSYVTADQRWISKLVIAAAINSVPIFQFAFFGYMLNVTRQVHSNSPDVLPEWDDLGDLFVRGLVVWLGLLIWTIPLIVVFGCGFVAALLADESGSLAIVSLCVLTP